MSNLKTSKIIQLTGNGTFNTDYGLFYNYEICMNNGDCGEYASKNYHGVDQLPFKVNDSIDYEWHDHDKFPKIKRPTIAGSKRWTPNQSGGNYKGGKSDEVQKLIVKQSCLERSIELLTHNMPTTKIKSSMVIELASVLTDWVMDGYNTKETPQPETTNNADQQPIAQPENKTEEDDDLPF